ncbi:hypothetical protein O0L34_g11965 [Tuta absoluta]|nr:hypothetical protein O0L34_g11965 [Tuta absoluta]
MATMENDIKFGRCRCCLKVGNHNSFSAPDRKVEYRETFLACFNLVLSTSDKLPDLICTSCVQELNDALTFRSKVVESEQLLLSETSRDTNDLSTEVECGLHSELNIKLESEELIKYELSMDCDNDSDIDSKDTCPNDASKLKKLPILHSDSLSETSSIIKISRTENLRDDAMIRDSSSVNYLYETTVRNDPDNKRFWKMSLLEREASTQATSSIEQSFPKRSKIMDKVSE